jgi:hypothetical protein
MYAMVATRPDIAYTVGIVSRFMHNPGHPHWNAVKHIFRYLVGTQDYGIRFGTNEPLGAVGFTNSDYAGCLDTRIHHQRSEIDVWIHFQIRKWRHFMEVETAGLHGD